MSRDARRSFTAPIVLNPSLRLQIEGPEYVGLAIVIVRSQPLVLNSVAFG